MIELRSYQQEAIDSLYAWFEQNAIGNPLLVLPTGAGKSLIAAKICYDALQFPNQRVLLLTHVRELIEQNFQALHRLWPEAPAGIYCAGLKKKQSHNPITFASIQSVHKKADIIGYRDIVIIDECHLVGDADGTMYRSFLQRLLEYNPNLRIIGLSATPYRLKSGYLHKGEDALFTDIAFDLPIIRLVNDGYLSPLVGKAAVTHINTKDISIVAGDFSSKELEEQFDEPTLIAESVKEVLQYGADRKSWLVFCVSIKHAKHVTEAFRESGIAAEVVSQETPSAERDVILREFKTRHIRAVVNVGVLTTGFDAPGIDLVAIMRSTMSPGLFVQICGRGMRLAPDKQNCLVLDFGENLLRHGPITHIKPPKEGRRKKDEEEGVICPDCRLVSEAGTEVCECGCLILSKECPNCKATIRKSLRNCPSCGYIWEEPRPINHKVRASYAEVMSDAPTITEIPTWFEVIRTTFELHEKAGSQPSMKVTYYLKHARVMEWLGFAHPKDYPKKLAAKWWMQRGGQAPVPETAEDALGRMEEIDGLRAKEIRVKKEDGWDRVTGCNMVASTAPMTFSEGNISTLYIQESNNVSTAAPPTLNDEIAF